MIALSIAHWLDILRRPSTLVLAAVGAALILSLRWFSAFGLGYEVVQLKELGVYTIGLLGALAVLLFWLPREDEGEDAQLLLLTRPVSPWVLAVGPFLGRAAAVAILFTFWSLFIAAAMLWLKLEDPLLFSYRGAHSVAAESTALIGPVAGQWLATLVLLALVQPLGRTRRPVVIAAGVLSLYLLGYASAALGGIGALLPDLSRLDSTAALWGMPGAELSLTQLLHACAWCAVGLALDSGVLRLRAVS